MGLGFREGLGFRIWGVCGLVVRINPKPSTPACLGSSPTLSVQERCQAANFSGRCRRSGVHAHLKQGGFVRHIWGSTGMHQDVYVCLGFRLRVCLTWKPKKVCFSSAQVLTWVWGAGFGIWTQAQVFIGLISGSMLLRDSLHEPCWGSLLGKYYQTLNPKP